MARLRKPLSEGTVGTEDGTAVGAGDGAADGAGDGAGPSSSEHAPLPASDVVPGSQSVHSVEAGSENVLAEHT